MLETDAGFASIRPYLRRRLTALFAHRVADDASPFTAHVYRHPSVAEFAQALDFLKRHFHFVTLADVVAHFADGRALADFPLFLSFDDGFREMAEIVAPMLHAEGVPATFFVTANAVDNRDLFYGLRRSYLIEQARLTPGAEARMLAASLAAASTHAAEGRAAVDHAAARLGVDWRAVLAARRPFLSEAQCRDLRDWGFTLGAHGASHRRFAELDGDARARELAESVGFLRTRFGLEHVAFAFPHSQRGVDKAWMAARLAAEDGPSIFFGTGGFAPNDRVLVHRVGLDRPAGEAGAFDIAALIARAYRRGVEKYGGL